MLRIASVLLVAVLLTTCIISGAFAKYITTANGADQAQVAKFGVNITVADDFGAFATQYDKEDNQYAGTLAVQSNTSVGDNTDNRVAPGTKGQMSFSITGTPEVAVRLSVVANATPIHLAAGTYNLAAGAYANGATEVVTTADYEPIKFYFGTTAIDENTEYTMTLAELETALETLSGDKDPNTTLDVTYYIGWNWEFEGNFEATIDGVAAQNAADFLDTYLAQEATLQKEVLDFTITVTQID